MSIYLPDPADERECSDCGELEDDCRCEECSHCGKFSPHVVILPRGWRECEDCEEAT